MSEMLSFTTHHDYAGSFEVDGEEYHLRSADSLNKTEEGVLMAKFRQVERLTERINISTDDREVAQLAEKVRDARVHVISQFTTCPTEIVEQLGVKSQNALLAAINKEMAPEEVPAEV